MLLLQTPEGSQVVPEVQALGVRLGRLPARLQTETENVKLPQPIIVELVRQQEAMGWPDMVPAYAEVKHADGRTLVYEHGDLTVALCEQLVEQHSRSAIAAINRFRANSSRRSCKTAAFHVLRARLYRCRYIQLTGKKNSTEADMPFPIESSK
jgi:hypothetical protein